MNAAARSRGSQGARRHGEMGPLVLVFLGSHATPLPRYRHLEVPR